MPAVVALVLTLALSPTPSPSAPSGPVGDLIGGVGQIVDDLLGGGSTPSASPIPTPTQTRPPSAGPSAPVAPAPVTPAPVAPAPVAPAPMAPVPTPTPAGSSAGSRPPAVPAAPDRTAGGRDTREAAVPLPNGNDPVDPPTLAAPDRSGWPLLPAYHLLIAGVLAVLALLLLRRRRAVGTAGSAGAPAPAPAPTPAPDPGPVPDNVSRLPTNLNAIYELGRLDERLEQERRHRS
ncbi:hypothetical protein [Micromonospora sp. U21]|uniref:hypothetical protein n=1 Tax=Micromonospora sp. U21 TaxID=2824899 RepID=UPI001B366E21|nr:hypothetical protein [Micromonospora sp. U21]MBQ0902287.1 hypothetical protein [Micromonospora sp. U21]